MGSMEDLFEGLPAELPEPMARGASLYAPEQPGLAKVRHAAGYSAFIAFCARHGVAAEKLASDPARLMWFLHKLGAEIHDENSVSAAAAVFAGNAIVGLRPDAQWTAYEGSPPLAGNRRKQFDVSRLLEALRSADDDAVSMLISVLSDWAREEVGSPAPALRPVSPGPRRARYVRPPLPTAKYYSPGGAAIPYGNRWGADGPAADSYSVLSHAERFAGLHSVALALIAHLTAVYDIDVDGNPGHAAELVMEAREVVQAIKVTPRMSGTASLTFVLTGYPGVLIHAGVLHDFPFPVCGCDACDETVESSADRMEMLVLTVAAGGYSERYPVGSRRWREYALAAFDGSGSESGSGGVETVDAARLQDAEARLREVTGGWRPWPLRH
ncbi:DUF6226 family protein [Arthrobacter sp. ISL-72]|uniref:DUF6226 family protein n=1 Tax=Arthrobacter sp. ISL-72 TaxID=2819114 RepID=UPI001BE63773|nr:DUF6226 family protein [Arthrobacter sp. ISL-72]MBT2597135.1 hypothetical protein [Arthrobacter sp. ISL-72]